jgi:tRNA pseudouridine38-40 synthase
MRFFFEIAYHGSHYAGWQSQKNAVGVQEIVESSLSKIVRREIKIVGSGRTDTGVHCRQQFFHADIDIEFETADLMHKLNAFLPRDIVIKSIHRVKPDAHARYDAIERSYEYHITKVKNPFLDKLALHYFKPLDVPRMNKAAEHLLGEHDFESFSKVKTDVNHFRCTVKKAAWKEEGDLLTFYISANRFLRGMVRAITGTLLDVGTGKITISEFQQIMASRDRKKAGMNVDPHGLYLTRVKYPASIFIKE